MFLRFILYLLLLWAVYAAVRGLLGGSRRPRGEAAQDGVDDVMSPCPECGAYFPVSIGVSRRAGGQKLLFCSEECAERHARRGS
ncbi:MAG: hypothetical protein HYR52_05100 [Candidatus Tectomicrobia bacterium]|nr:hypothetical protein [Candidatus Tectomicrobia bacterium]MBI2178349.1 hypothetical protein [Candidatus Tectomicrobia bacterium]MBI3025920.1 hypothetical protein [Candidatus Tectomicrobia bacterium]